MSVMISSEINNNNTNSYGGGDDVSAGSLVG